MSKYHLLCAIHILQVILLCTQINIVNATLCKTTLASTDMKVAASMCYDNENTAYVVAIDTYGLFESPYTSCTCTLTSHKDPSAGITINEAESLNPSYTSCGSQITFTVPRDIEETKECVDNFFQQYQFKTMTITWSITDRNAINNNSNYCFLLASPDLMTVKCEVPKLTTETPSTVEAITGLTTSEYYTTSSTEAITELPMSKYYATSTVEAITKMTTSTNPTKISSVTTRSLSTVYVSSTESIPEDRKYLSMTIIIAAAGGGGGLVLIIVIIVVIIICTRKRRSKSASSDKHMNSETNSADNKRDSMTLQTIHNDEGDDKKGKKFESNHQNKDNGLYDHIESSSNGVSKFQYDDHGLKINTLYHSYTGPVTKHRDDTGPYDTVDEVTNETDNKTETKLKADFTDGNLYAQVQKKPKPKPKPRSRSQRDSKGSETITAENAEYAQVQKNTTQHRDCDNYMQEQNTANRYKNEDGLMYMSVEVTNNNNDGRSARERDTRGREDGVVYSDVVVS